MKLKRRNSTSSPQAEDRFEYAPDGSRYYKKSIWKEGSSTKTTYTYYGLGGMLEQIVPASDPTIDHIDKVRISSVVQYTKTTLSGGGTTSEFLYLHRDHLGSVDVITNGSGSLVDRLAFDPFGGRRQADWSKDITQTELDQILDNGDKRTYRGFTDHEHLDRTGIVHMNGRIYDPVIGRFLSADPIVQAPLYFIGKIQLVGTAGYSVAKGPGYDVNVIQVLRGYKKGTNAVSGSLDGGTSSNGELSIGIVYGNVLEPTLSLDLNLTSFAVDIFLDPENYVPVGITFGVGGGEPGGGIYLTDPKLFFCSRGRLSCLRGEE